MAKQLICDRPHHVVISNDSEYLPMLVKQPDGSDKHIDLCFDCGNDFKAFLNTNPAQPANQPAGQVAAPAQPAADVANQNLTGVQGETAPVDNQQQ